MLLTVTEVDLYVVGFDEIVEPDNETDRPSPARGSSTAFLSNTTGQTFALSNSKINLTN